MTVGGELALTAHVSPGEVVHEWHGTWANWDELQSSAEVKVLLENFAGSHQTHEGRNERVIEKWAERPSLGTSPFESAVSFTHVASFRCISWFSIGYADDTAIACKFKFKSETRKHSNITCVHEKCEVA